ncbi:MAG TPA: helix-turn-helix transcriptional regulator [Iamia sp.]
MKITFLIFSPILAIKDLIYDHTDGSRWPPGSPSARFLTMNDDRWMSVDQMEERLGRNIRATRLAQDLSQSELADRANVSLGAVKSLEKGRGSTITTFVKVMRALGQQSWIDTVRPPSRAFNPLDLLAAQERPPRPSERQRVSRARRSEERRG